MSLTPLLLVRSPNWIGDTVLSTSLVGLLKKEIKNARITILTKEYVKDLWLNNPYVDEIISFKSYIEILRKINNKGFDCALILPNSFSSAFTIYLSGIRERIGYRTGARSFVWKMLTKELPLIDSREKHLIFEYLEFAKIYNIKTDTVTPELFITQEEEEKADKILRDNKIYSNDVIIGICPGATYGPAKKWPGEYWEKVVNDLIKKYNVRILMFGDGKDNDILNEISKRQEDKLINFSGKLNLRMLMALINKCKIFVSNDTGPMHIAAALNIPVVALFGSSSPVWTGPVGKHHKIIYKNISCSPCFKRTCKINNKYECLKSITPEEVIESIESYGYFK